MLDFIKKLFAKKEIPEEKVELNKLSTWLDEKAKPISEKLNNNINQIINKINNEKEKAFENIKKLENAKLQNPKIPERVKTIMQGNREAFIKKTSFFFNNIDLKFNDHNEILEKCNNIENEIDLLGKATAKSYQVLNEFFAREAENVAIGIKKVESYSKDIKNSIKNSEISGIEKIKDDIANIQRKIRLKEKYSNDLEDNKNNSQKNKNKLLETENKINEIRSSGDYKNYERLLEDANKIQLEINDIENKLFHDFSALEKALRKYSKIAFEDEELILEYAKSPIKALMTDESLKIIKILKDLEKNIVDNKLELDAKKSDKTISRIRELEADYFADNKNNFKNLNEKLDRVKSEIRDNNAKKELDSYNNELDNIKLNIEKLDNSISSLNNELGKIDIEKLKENLQEEVNKLLDVKVIVSS